MARKMYWQLIETESELIQWFEYLNLIGIGYAIIILHAPHPIETLPARELGEEFGIVVDIIKDYKIQWN